MQIIQQPDQIVKGQLETPWLITFDIINKELSISYVKVNEYGEVDPMANSRVEKLVFNAYDNEKIATITGGQIINQVDLKEATVVEAKVKEDVKVEPIEVTEKPFEIID